MRVSSNWLKDYIDLDITPEELSKKMVLIGNEVASIVNISDSTNLVIGHVLEKYPHPDSDHLNVCKVDLGDGIYQIVCGAKNVNANQKVIVARVGATLPNDIVIQNTTIRGVESNGMICSLEELGIESKYIPESSKGGIHVLEPNAPVGENALKYLCYDDTVLDIELTADRSDLLSILGIAYETGAIINKKIKLPEIKIDEISEDVNNYISIESTTSNCPMYLSRIVKDVVITDSPNFIKARLMASGIRPINNVVDISNYVMLEYGQPLHFFDYDKLGSKIIVRMSNENETMTTLDGIERKLKDDILITTQNEIVALAGVMGGLSTEVTNNTKTILIESALFNPLNIRYTSKRVLRSEASARFEKGIDSNRTIEALNRAAYLLQTYASGKVLKGIAGYNNIEQSQKVINITQEKIKRVLGMEISIESIEDALNRLDFKYEVDSNNFKVYAPSRRLDVVIQEDLIEEIGRIHGYDKMIGTLPISKIKRGTYSKKYLFMKNVHNRLRSLGLNEVITYSLQNGIDTYKFTNDSFEKLELISPLSEDKKTLRYSLIPSLLRTIDYNISRNIRDINIYEIGRSYYKLNDEYKEDTKICIAISGMYLENSFQGKKINSDFYLLKGIVENLLNYLGLSNRYKFVKGSIPKEYHPGKSAEVLLDNISIGYIGNIHPNINKNDIYVCELNLDKLSEFNVRKIKFKEIPKYPSIIKDMSFIFDKNIESIDVINTIKRVGGKVITDVDVFDLYEGSNIGDNKKSIAFKLTFMDLNKTLTDEEVITNFNNIINTIEKEYNAELRNK